MGIAMAKPVPRRAADARSRESSVYLNNCTEKKNNVKDCVAPLEENCYMQALGRRASIFKVERERKVLKMIYCRNQKKISKDI